MINEPADVPPESIECPDVAGESARPEGLGATRVQGPMSEHGSTWVVMHDPAGNEFCVCDGPG